MRWTPQLAEDRIEVELVSVNSSESSYTFRVDGEEVRIGRAALDHGSLLFEGEQLVPEAWTSSRWRARLQDQIIDLKPVDRSKEAAGGQTQLKSEMPGKILQVLVKSGDQVESGQTLLIMEAMKMENEIRAERAPQIKEVFVKASQSVESGSLLMEFESGETKSSA